MVDLQTVHPVEYGEADLQAAMELFAEHIADVIRHQPARLHVRLASNDPMVEAYLAWCRGRDSPGDCLDILDTSTPGISNGGKRSIALRIALGSALREVADAVRRVDPVKVEVLMLVWFSIYLVSFIAPDVTVTKALTLVMSANMVAFLGWDGFRTFIQGYLDMATAADAAQTFAQVYDAGRAFGRRMGPSMARIVTMIVTLGLSSVTGMATPPSVTNLPRGAQAVANARAQGFNLAAVSGGSISVSANGTVTLVLAAEATVDPKGTSKQPAEQPGSKVQTDLVSKVKGQLWRYPKVIDPRTGRPIPFPTGHLKPVPVQQRASWGNAERGAFIREWHRRGYDTPRGGWDNYDIHHIHPRELGGGNDFWNLVPVERGTHQAGFNTFWMEFME